MLLLDDADPLFARHAGAALARRLDAFEGVVLLTADAPAASEPTQNDAIERNRALVFLHCKAMLRGPLGDVASVPLLHIGLRHEECQQAKVDPPPPVAPPERDEAVRQGALLSG